MKINPALLPIPLPDKRLAPVTGALAGSYRTTNPRLNPLKLFSVVWWRNLNLFFQLPGIFVQIQPPPV